MVHCTSGAVRVLLTCLVLASSASPASSLSEGSACQTKDGEPGKCALVGSCRSELKKIQSSRHYRPVSCGIKGSEPIVCCTDKKNATKSGDRRCVQACKNYKRELETTYVPYIINGQNTEDGEFPHMVALGYKRSTPGYDWFCGGSLISSRYVLTAAHCIANVRGSPEVAWLGAYNLSHSEHGRQYRVDQAVLHPEYSATAHYYDIALLKLLTVAKFDTAIYPACLYTQPDDPPSAIVTGWGTFDEDLTRTSDVLLKATLRTVPIGECNNTYTGKFTSSRLARGIAPEMICARGADRMTDTCSGDSGGPMHVRHKNSGVFDLVGITSFGRICGATGVYVRVASFLDWIEPIVWPES